MTKQEFLAASLPYGLKLYNGGSIDNLGYESYANLSIWTVPEAILAGIKPIIRPLDSLTKECVQADYNDGKPFIPIVELANMAFPKYACFLSDSSGEYVSVDTDYDYFRFGFDGYNFHYNGGYIPNQLQLFQLLIKWHFWPNKPVNEEVVYVSENFNPYK